LVQHGTGARGLERTGTRGCGIDQGFYAFRMLVAAPLTGVAYAGQAVPAWQLIAAGATLLTALSAALVAYVTWAVARGK
jgi:hypothetical protein